ncbi:hypothetical protein D3C81_719260 [compost metagenome]
MELNQVVLGHALKCHGDLATQQRINGIKRVVTGRVFHFRKGEISFFLGHRDNSESRL